jgi:hypothetical protein
MSDSCTEVRNNSKPWATGLLVVFTLLFVITGCDDRDEYTKVLDNREELADDIRILLTSSEYFKSCGVELGGSIHLSLSVGVWDDETEANRVLEAVNLLIPKHLPLTTNDGRWRYCNTSLDTCEIKILTEPGNDSLIIAIVAVYDQGKGRTVTYNFASARVRAMTWYEKKNKSSIAAAKQPTRLREASNAPTLSTAAQKRLAFAQYLNNGMEGEATIVARGEDYKILRYQTSIMTKGYAYALYMGSKDKLEEFGFECIEYTDGGALLVVYKLFP